MARDSEVIDPLKGFPEATKAPIHSQYYYYFHCIKCLAIGSNIVDCSNFRIAISGTPVAFGFQQPVD